MRTIKVLDYPAEFYADRVEFGCQKVPYHQLFEIEKALMELDERKSATRGRSVSQLIHDKHDGKWFTAKINGNFAFGRIKQYRGYWYLYQNVISGSEPSDGEKHGYDFSWTVLDGTAKEMRFNEVFELRVYESNPYPKAPRPKVIGNGRVMYGSITWHHYRVGNDKVKAVARAARREIKNQGI